MENNCLDVTNDLHQLLVGILQREHGFQFFGADMEDTYFEILFPIDSPIRQLKDQKIERLMLHVVPFEDNTRIRLEMKSTTGRMIISPSLGYEHGEKIFITKESVLEECIRLAWSPVPRVIPELLKSNGECSVCFLEGTVVEWPCHSSHVTCEECFVKITARNSRCPLCREVIIFVT
jgi:hypothetical protein